METLPRVGKRRSVISRMDEIFISEDGGDNLVSITIKPLLHNGRTRLQCASDQLVAAGVAEVELVLVVVCFALNCDCT